MSCDLYCFIYMAHDLIQCANKAIRRKHPSMHRSCSTKWTACEIDALDAVETEKGARVEHRMLLDMSERLVNVLKKKILKFTVGKAI